MQDETVTMPEDPDEPAMPQEQSNEDHYNEPGIPPNHNQTSDATHSQSESSEEESQSSESDTEPSPEYLADATPSEIADMYERERQEESAVAEVDDDEEVPLTALEEARELGLCWNYSTDHPFLSPYMPTPPETLVDDLEDPAGAPDSRFSAALDLVSTGERWDVDKDSAGFLASVLALGRESAGAVHLEEAHGSFGDLKIDEPILQRDPGLELLHLRRRNKVGISTQGMHPFEVDVEKGESALWPSSDLLIPAEKHREVAAEKLEVDLGVMKYLWDLAEPKPMSTAEMMTAFIDSDKPVTLRPETPPLLPISPPYSPKPLPPALMEMELTSTPEDLMAAEAAEMNRDIMAMDEQPNLTVRDQPEAVDSVELYSSLRTPQTSSSSPLRHKRLRDLKAEVPLTPQDPMESPPKKSKTVSFPEEVLTLMPLPDSDMSIMDTKVAHQDLDELVNDFIMPRAESAIRKSQNEHLSEVDTTMRVPVPAMADDKPAPPWRIFSAGMDPDTAAQKALLSFIKREVITKDEGSWSGVSKLERTLSWSPFAARLGKVNVVEGFDEDRSSARYMAEIAFGDSIDIDSLISKTSGLRILDGHESDDDDLEPAEVYDECLDEDLEIHPEVSAAASPSLLPPVTNPLLPAKQQSITEEQVQAPTPQPGRIDMQTLLWKRKLELEVNTKKEALAIEDAEDAAPQPETQKPRLSTAGFKPSRVGDLLHEGGIAGFMRLHGGMPKPQTKNRPQTFGHAQPGAPPAVMVPPMQIEEENTLKLPKMPAPGLVDPARSIQVVVATQLMQNRAFIRKLQRLLPGIDLIEREAFASSASKDNREMASMEVDITVSPRVGVLMTTLQKLKQKPLPGHTDFFGVHERIAVVSARHEKLIVLISEGRQAVGMHALDDRDCEAVSDLTGFLATLDAEVEVQFVPGGEDDLVRWAAAAISQQAVSGVEMKLLQEETLWERFLRTAGMNAFAAQVILSKLKLPESSPGSDGSTGTPEPHMTDGLFEALSEPMELAHTVAFGLTAFVRMSLDERIARFGTLMGGERVLRRVGDAIDAGWMSARLT